MNNYMKVIIEAIKQWVNKNLAVLDEKIDTKVESMDSKGLSTNDYTNEEKDKLAGIEAGATNTVIDVALNAESENPVQNKAIKSEFDNVNASIEEVRSEIPDAVVNPSTASVGQTIVVKAVDDTGKPTEWEAVDMPESVSIDPTLTIVGAAADAKAVGEALQDVSANYVKSSEKAATNGVATLDASGKLQESQKPSYSASEVGLGNVPNVATNDQTPTYTEASTLATLTSGEKLSVAFGKIKKAITDLISHIANTSNPHAVTAEQAGAAPTSHASTATTYGKATSSNYGHVKLSASTSSTSGASAGVAATPSAVKSAYDLASSKQDAITVSSVTGQTKAITCGSTVTLASLALEAGTYLVFGNAKFPSASSTSGKYVIQCCLSKSTTYNHNASMAIPNNSAAASTLNPHGVFTLSSAGTIYLLGYHGGDSTMTVENINLYAVKIG